MPGVRKRRSKKPPQRRMHTHSSKKPGPNNGVQTSVLCPTYMLLSVGNMDATALEYGPRSSAKCECTMSVHLKITSAMHVCFPFLLHRNA